MRRLFGYWLLLFALSVAFPVTANTLKYIPPADADDPQKAYYVMLLETLCAHSNQLGTPCEVVPVDVEMFQQRQLRSLDEGLLDVMWTVTTKERESRFLPIRIPLTKGLIGYRIAVFNNVVANSFAKNGTLAAIKKLKHVQGHDWPDTQILKHNGFEVASTSWYSSMYKSLDAQHYDVILRGVFEINTEFNMYATDNVSIDKNHAFYYPSAIYFFVSQKKPQLAELITQSLMSLKANGEFDKILFEFTPHSNAVATLELENRRVHQLENPLLPSKTPLENSEFWFQDSPR